MDAVKVLATQRGDTLSTVVADAIRAALEGTASQTLLEDLKQQQTIQGQTITALEHAITVLTLAIREMQALLTKQDKMREQVIDAANLLYDYVAARNGQALPAGSRLKQFFTPRR